MTEFGSLTRAGQREDRRGSLTRRGPITFKETLQGGVKVKKRRPVSDAQDSVILAKVDGTPLGEKEEAEAERLYRIYWETLPGRLFMEPITLLIKPLKEWLSVKFDALYGLVSISEPNTTGHVGREVFVDFFVQSSIEYIQKHLPAAINTAVKMVTISMHDQVPAGIARIGGMPADEAEKHYVATRKDLKDRFEIILRERGRAMSATRASVRRFLAGLSCSDCGQRARKIGRIWPSATASTPSRRKSRPCTTSTQ